MAKGQKRSNREAKKPKADKRKTLASTGHYAERGRQTAARRGESGD